MQVNAAPFKTQYVSQSRLAIIWSVLLTFSLSLFALSGIAQSGVSRDEMVYTVVEKQPEFPGGLQALWDYLQVNVNYPDAAQKAGVRGRVLVSLIVWRDGRVTDITSVYSIGYGCDEEAVRVIKTITNWIPGSQSGKTVNVKMTVPFLFGVPYPKVKKTSRISRPSLKQMKIIELRPAVADGHHAPPIVDIPHSMPSPPKTKPAKVMPDSIFGDCGPSQPEFPGGMKALAQCIRKNVRYPEAAKQAGVTGRVFASFVIDTAGYVSQPQILKGLGYGCDEEVVRLVSELPRWKPAMQLGRGVAVKYNLPINFPPKPCDLSR